MPVTPFQRYQSTIVKSFFVDTADHNYIMARWAFHHRLYRDFYWNALHCLEKYLKSALLLNGVSVKKKSHNISSMFQDLSVFASDLLPSLIIRPSRINEHRNWKTEPLDKFIERIESQGNPHNRYAYFSYFQSPDDLIKLDGTVFLVRRLCVGLDWDIARESELINGTYRTWLAEDSSFQPRGRYPTFPTLSDQQAKTELETALFRLNFAFMRAESDLAGTWQGGSASNSWLYLLTETRKEGEVDQERSEVISWLIQNVFFDKATEDYLKKKAQEFGRESRS